MAVMDSLTVWTDAAGGRRRGLEWRDAVTARMMASGSYAPYESLVAEAAAAMPPPGTDPAATMFVAGSPYDAAGARAAGLRSTLVVRRPDHHADDATIIVVAASIRRKREVVFQEEE